MAFVITMKIADWTGQPLHVALCIDISIDEQCEVLEETSDEESDSDYTRFFNSLEMGAGILSDTSR